MQETRSSGLPRSRTRLCSACAWSVTGQSRIKPASCSMRTEIAAWQTFSLPSREVVRVVTQSRLLSDSQPGGAFDHGSHVRTLAAVYHAWLRSSSLQPGPRLADHCAWSFATPRTGCAYGRPFIVWSGSGREWPSRSRTSLLLSRDRLFCAGAAEFQLSAPPRTWPQSRLQDSRRRPSRVTCPTSPYRALIRSARVPRSFCDDDLCAHSAAALQNLALFCFHRFCPPPPLPSLRALALTLGEPTQHSCRISGPSTVRARAKSSATSGTTRRPSGSATSSSAQAKAAGTTRAASRGSTGRNRSTRRSRTSTGCSRRPVCEGGKT